MYMFMVFRVYQSNCPNKSIRQRRMSQLIPSCNGTIVSCSAMLYKGGRRYDFVVFVRILLRLQKKKNPRSDVRLLLSCSGGFSSCITCTYKQGFVAVSERTNYVRRVVNPL